MPTDQHAAQRQERFVDVGTALEADPEPTELMQPRQRPLHNPAMNSETAAVRRVSFGQDGLDAASAQFLAVGFGIVAPIPLHGFGPASRVPDFPRDWWDRIYQGHQLRYVMGVGGAENRCQRNALRIRDDVVLAARLAPVGRVGARFSPPKTARTDALSTTARDQSIASASRNLASRTSWTFCQTPCSCHACKYRQHVMPEPHPISFGNISQGMPLRSTNKIPVSTFRRSIGLRPGYRNRRGFGGGSSGSMIPHNSSDTSGLAIPTTSSLLEMAPFIRKAEPQSQFLVS